MRDLSYGTILIIVLALLGCGCGGGLTEEQFVGRWVEDKEERRFEFTKNRLFSVVENGTFVKIGTWSVQGDQLVLDYLFEGEDETWKPDLSDNRFTIDLGEARFRAFERVPSTETIFDKRLVGLWRTDDKTPQIVEFTEHATLVGVFWRIAEVGGEPFPIGVQANVSKGGDSKFFLDGYLGDRRMNKGVIPHPFKIENGRLVWGAGRKHPPKVYRKVTPADINEPGMTALFAGKKTPTTTSTPSPTP